VIDHLSWPSVTAARGGSLRLAPPSSTGTGTMCAGGARSQLPAGEHTRHHAPAPLRHAGNAVCEVWVMHSPPRAGTTGAGWHPRSCTGRCQVMSEPEARALRRSGACASRWYTDSRYVRVTGASGQRLLLHQIRYDTSLTQDIRIAASKHSLMAGGVFG
jgi:hypothetical protein